LNCRNFCKFLMEFSAHLVRYLGSLAFVFRFFMFMFLILCEMPLRLNSDDCDLKSNQIKIYKFIKSRRTKLVTNTAITVTQHDTMK